MVFPLFHPFSKPLVPLTQSPVTADSPPSVGAVRAQRRGRAAVQRASEEDSGTRREFAGCRGGGRERGREVNMPAPGGDWRTGRVNTFHLGNFSLLPCKPHKNQFNGSKFEFLLSFSPEQCVQQMNVELGKT